MIEVQDIFRQHCEEYRKEHRLPSNILKAMGAIESCRTSELGGHIDVCEDCGHSRISYNSCRNRHCPKCQTLAKEKWLMARKDDLLPVGYFHVVLTIPEELNYLCSTNQKVMYDILFKATSETLLELASDKKYIGAEIGFMSILHTWGQNLMHHPHIHCIVPSGGLTLDGVRWVRSSEKFFIPVRVLSKKFRGKFMHYFVKAYDSGLLKLTEGSEDLKDKNIFQCFKDKLYTTKWVVYCKAPFKSAEFVLEYLGRYTHRVAISNNRIINFENGYVTYKWRDYRDKNKVKFMTVTAEEFIRRFLMHVLPSRFVKIRHYGILSNRNRATKLKKCKRLTGVLKKTLKDSVEKLSAAELLFKLTGININLCPSCNEGKMVRKGKVEPRSYTPPRVLTKTA